MAEGLKALQGLILSHAFEFKKPEIATIFLHIMIYYLCKALFVSHVFVVSMCFVHYVLADDKNKKHVFCYFGHLKPMTMNLIVCLLCC